MYILVKQSCSFGLSSFSLLIPVLHLFQEVLKATRTQLERELSLDDVFSIRDLPAYNMLTR